MQEEQKIDYTSIISRPAIMLNAEIKTILPHRYPFLLVDKVMLLEEFKQIIAIKNVTANEEFFNGHFPQMPIMPGVMMVEAMAQVSGILGIKSTMLRDGVEVDNPPTVFLLSVDEVKFRQPVVPGDVLVMHCIVEKTRGEICISNCQSFVLGKKVCEAKITAKFSFNNN